MTTTLRRQPVANDSGLLQSAVIFPAVLCSQLWFSAVPAVSSFLQPAVAFVVRSLLQSAVALSIICRFATSAGS